MMSIMSMLLILVLGACGGVIMRRFNWPVGAAAALAALGATLGWVAGCYVLFWLTAPNELGPLQARPILLTYLTALCSAVAVIWWGKASNARR